MRIFRDLKVLDVSEQVVVRIAELVERRQPRLLHRTQIQRSSESVCANIGEAFGRESKADRDRVLVIARGEAEETIRHLRTNFLRARIGPGEYWPLHNRLVTIVKMLTNLIT
jgi:four helix bundle protein